MDGEPVISLRTRDIEKKTFFDTSKRERGRVKHYIVKKYFQAWLPTLGYGFKNAKEIIYVDGFAGAGTYDNGEETEDGSPLVVYKAAISHCHASKIFPTVRLIFVEIIRQNAIQLEKNLMSEAKKAEKEYPEAAKKVKFEVWQMRFDEYMDKIFAEDNEKKRPLLVFADPFGFSGKYVPFSTMKRLAERPVTDVILNFMDSFMHRFKSRPEVENAITSLLGTNEWKQLVKQENWNVSDFLKLYKKELLGANNNLLFLNFSIKSKVNAHVYNLLYFTRHPKGIKAMKKPMDDQSQQSLEFVFSEFVKNKFPDRNDKISAEEKLQDIINRLKQHFDNQTVLGSTIEMYIWCETPYCIDKEVGKRELKGQLEEYCQNPNVGKFDNQEFKFPDFLLSQISLEFLLIN